MVPGSARVQDVRLAQHRRDRHPPTHRLRPRRDVGDDAGVLVGRPATRATEARLDLVEDEHDPVQVADLAQAAQIGRGRRDEAALAEDGLDDDRRHLARGDHVDEGLLEAGELALHEGLEVESATVAEVVGKGQPVDLGGERATSDLVARLRGQRHAHHRPAVEGLRVAEDGLPPGGLARELDRVLDRLRPGVEQHRLGGPAVRQDAHELLAQGDIGLVRGHVDARVDEAGRLLLDRAHDVRVAVPDVHHADAAREIDEVRAVGVHETGAGRGRCGGLAGELTDCTRHHGAASLDELIVVGHGSDSGLLAETRVTRCYGIRARLNTRALRLGCVTAVLRRPCRAPWCAGIDAGQTPSRPPHRPQLDLSAEAGSTRSARGAGPCPRRPGGSAPDGATPPAPRRDPARSTGSTDGGGRRPRRPEREARRGARRPASARGPRRAFRSPDAPPPP